MNEKLAIITDIHFCIRNSSPYFAERYRLFFENIFFPHLEKNGIKTILDLGDTFEDRKSINVYGMQSARNIFFDVAQDKGIKIIAILGNHDVFHKNTNAVNSMDILGKAYDNIHIVDEYEEFKFGDKIFGMMSWVNNENLERNLKRIKETSRANYLLGHYEISGAEMTRGHFAESGFSQDIFAKFEKVLSGHFHIRSRLGNIDYLGNPFQTNWGDFGYERGFHAYDFVTHEFEFVPNTYNTYDMLSFDDSCDHATFNYDHYKDITIKIIVDKVADLNQVNYINFLEKISEVCHEYSVIETGTISFDDVEVVELKSNTMIISEYVKTLNLEESKEKAIMDIMQERFKEASAQLSL